MAAARTETLGESGSGTLEALTGGYHAAFMLGALCAAAAATIGGVFLRTRAMPDAAHEGLPQPALAESD